MGWFELPNLAVVPATLPLSYTLKPTFKASLICIIRLESWRWIPQVIKQKIIYIVSKDL